MNFIHYLFITFVFHFDKFLRTFFHIQIAILIQLYIMIIKLKLSRLLIMNQYAYHENQVQ
jgi:hypothetical protein